MPGYQEAEYAVACDTIGRVQKAPIYRTFIRPYLLALGLFTWPMLFSNVVLSWSAVCQGMSNIALSETYTPHHRDRNANPSPISVATEEGTGFHRTYKYGAYGDLKMFKLTFQIRTWLQSFSTLAGKGDGCCERHLPKLSRFSGGMLVQVDWKTTEWLLLLWDPGGLRVFLMKNWNTASS